MTITEAVNWFLINKSVTSRDSQADLAISDSIGKVLEQLWNNRYFGTDRRKKNMPEERLNYEVGDIVN